MSGTMSTSWEFRVCAWVAVFVGSLSAVTAETVCPEIDKDEIATQFELNTARNNYVIFNHKKGIIEVPVPAELEVRDSDVFAVIFACSDPARFDYRIEAIETASIQKTPFDTTMESVDTPFGFHVSVTWRHDRHFPLYRVRVSRRKEAEAPSAADTASTISGMGGRADLPTAGRFLDLSRSKAPDPQALSQLADDSGLSAVDAQKVLDLLSARPLSSYTFPIWVKTVGWRLTFATGFGFSDLTSEKFFIETDDNGSPEDANDDTKLVERDTNAEDDFQPNLMAFANLQLPSELKWARKSGLGLGFGLGIGSEAEPRYFFGPSFRLGRQFVLTAGWTGGKVEILPTGQRLGEAPINGDNTLNTLPTKFKNGVFVGIAFNFAPAEKEFTSALTGAQKIEVPEGNGNQEGSAGETQNEAPDSQGDAEEATEEPSAESEESNSEDAEGNPAAF